MRSSFIGSIQSFADFDFVNSCFILVCCYKYYYFYFILFIYLFFGSAEFILEPTNGT